MCLVLIAKKERAFDRPQERGVGGALEKYKKVDKKKPTLYYCKSIDFYFKLFYVFYYVYRRTGALAAPPQTHRQRVERPSSKDT